MIRINNEGLYEITINGVKEFACYQYAIKTKRGKLIYKSDPYAFHSELRPAKASKVYNLKGYKFKDSKWMKNRIKTLITNNKKLIKKSEKDIYNAYCEDINEETAKALLEVIDDTKIERLKKLKEWA